MWTSTKALRAIGLLAFWLLPAFAAAATKPKNVLFIAVDDENANIAGRPENTALVAELSKQLTAGWRAAGPPARK